MVNKGSHKKLYLNRNVMAILQLYIKRMYEENVINNIERKNKNMKTRQEKLKF